jgi:hypothetical protein
MGRRKNNAYAALPRRRKAGAKEREKRRTIFGRETRKSGAKAQQTAVENPQPPLM